MMSNKWAFSLTTLITIFALAFAVTPAMAGPFEIKITGPTKANYAGDGTGAVTVNLKVSSGQPIADLVATAAPATTDTITVTALDKDGFVIDLADTGTGTVAVLDLPKSSDTPTDPVYAMKTPKEHQLQVTITPADADTGADVQPDIARVIISIKGAITSSDVTLAAADSKSKADAVRHTITLSTAADISMLPKVVSIQRLRPGSQTVVAAFQEEKITTDPFNVRIVLTGRPHKDNGEIRHLAVGDIDVENGTASDLVVGIPFARHAQGDGSEADDTLRPHPIEGMYEHAGDGALAGVLAGVAGSGNVPMPTGTGNSMYHQYRVTITPHQKSADFTIKIKVKNFHDGASPIRNSYVSPGFGESGNLPNGREILSINVKGAARNLTAGYKVTIPKDWIIPANGYLIIAKSKSNSRIDTSGQDADRTNDTPRATHRTPAQLKYNVYETGDLPNLATQFLNGVVVDVQSQHAGLVVSEVMWGEDVSLIDRTHSQWIELYNPGAQYKTVADADHTPDVNEALTLIFYRPNEFADIPAVGTDGSLPAGITDRIGTLDTTGAYWSTPIPGQNGASGIANVQTTGDIERTVAPSTIIPVVSMYRVMAADGTIDDMMGQMAASWMRSEGPKSANFHPLALGLRHGTPGAATDATRTPADDTADEEAEAAKKKAADDKAAAEAEKIRNTGTIPTAGRIYISEIMFAGGGILPQWIEIANGSATEDVNLSGWTLTIANAVADADVSIGASAKFTIPNGTMIDRSRQEGATKTPSTILIVTETGRNNIDGSVSDQVINLAMDNEVELILAGVTKRKYTLLSDEAFLITLAPPEPEKSTPPAGETAAAKAKRMAQEREEAAMRKEATDMAGNLDADGTAAWALPMSEHGRSSIIRSHVNVRIGPAEPEGDTPTGSDGPLSATRETDWVLAENTAFKDPTHIRQATYYGAMSDEGTPGFRAGGALPVELSHFRPARDKATGAAVITWATESELNNAGFFIKRSNQRNGEFKVINATMVPGAGTTSEKQFYTYTDTTAQPNVVYYYQIEDVSLDGNRQTLTRGIRLKGHVGAAGKATVIWGELKTSHE